MRPIALAGTILLVAFLCRPLHADEPAGREYPIRLFVPYKLHEKYTLAGSATQEVQARIITPGRPEQKMPPESIAVQFEFAIEALSLDSKGQATKSACTIKKFVRTDGKRPADILPKGSVVIVDATGVDPETKKPDVKFTLNGGVLKKEQLDSLQLVLDASRPESPTTDECYGTAAAQKVGADWPITPNKAARDPAFEGWSLAPGHSKSKVTLVGVDAIDGMDWLKVSIEVSSDKLDEPGVEKSKLEQTTVVSVPLNATSPAQIGRSDVTTAVTSKDRDANGNLVVAETTTKQHFEWRFAPQVSAKS
jgi:hypothetical protein